MAVATKATAMVVVVVAVVAAVDMAAEAEAVAVDAVALAATEDLRAVKPTLLSIRKRALRSLFVCAATPSETA